MIWDKRATGEIRKVTVNGVTLHYEVVGEGKPVVLVHGNGEDHHLFDMEIEQLAAAGIPAGLVRMSCGLESKEDLIEDIKQALEAI